MKYFLIINDPRPRSFEFSKLRYGDYTVLLFKMKTRGHPKGSVQ